MTAKFLFCNMLHFVTRIFIALFSESTHTLALVNAEVAREYWQHNRKYFGTHKRHCEHECPFNQDLSLHTRVPMWWRLGPSVYC
ncbi:hypothetical protein Glove_465g70 [Diversispora epigaea]|uniref:Secreted protein n=1 Tax=Diversispora epigaea TaxID=1348612 RepID=A0A397GRI6_9GLOM|nr:hypothetical protein Glove_465g70 [Diversispora epigaea]